MLLVTLGFVHVLSSLRKKTAVTEVILPDAFRAAQLTSSSGYERMNVFGEIIPGVPDSVCLWDQQKWRTCVQCSASSSPPKGSHSP